MSKLLEELKKLPEYENFEKAVNENLTLDSFYVREFAPEKKGYYDERDDDGKIVYHHYSMTDEQVEKEAIENLLEDETGSFEEFVTCVLTKETVELARALIKRMRG